MKNMYALFPFLILNLVFALAAKAMDEENSSNLIQVLNAHNITNIHSILLLKDNELLYERYFDGTDQAWGEAHHPVSYTSAILHDTRSISKSVTSACIGILVKLGNLRVDEKVFEILPEFRHLAIGKKAQLTLKHFLTMTMGLKWNERVSFDDPVNSEYQMNESKDPVAFILAQDLEHAPGAVWEYSGGSTHVLAAIIKKLSGLDVDKFAHENLFEPLGINNFSWNKYKGSNQPAAASGLRLCSKDLAKFALLYAQEGRYNNKQILSEEWVTESFSSYIERPDMTKYGYPNGGYGYQFWILEDTIGEQPLQIVAAIGNGGQRIFWLKEPDLIMVTTAGNYNQWDPRNEPYGLLKAVLPLYKKN